MKQFKNLYEAFNYQPNCPICNGPIEADYKEIHMEGTHLKSKVVTTFIVGPDEVTIDYYDNTVIAYKQRLDCQITPAYSNKATYYSNSNKTHLSRSGLDIFKVTASCGSCSKYGSVLQMHIDLGKGMLMGIFLNSESISIEEGDTLHEIKNIYAAEKTEYDKFTRFEVDTETTKASGWSGRRNGTITFPLMPLDVKNPDKLLQRIKNLIIYT